MRERVARCMRAKAVHEREQGAGTHARPALEELHEASGGHEGLAQL